MVSATACSHVSKNLPKVTPCDACAIALASAGEKKTVPLAGAESVFEHGIAQLALKKTEHATDLRPIDEQCQCYTCRNHSRAYLHHLVRAHEPMAATLLTIHNLQFMSDLMSQVRERILNDEI